MTEIKSYEENKEIVKKIKELFCYVPFVRMINCFLSESLTNDE